MEKTSNPIGEVEVVPIKGLDGWSFVSVKINDRKYRWDMETEAAQELEKRLKAT